MKNSKIHYRNSYGMNGEQLRSFNIFGFILAEEIGVYKLRDKFMIFKNDREKAQMTVSLINHPDNITVDQFITEFNRLRNLPYTGKNLFNKIN
jgi:hypothetical protein